MRPMQGEDLNNYIDVAEDLKKFLMVSNTNLFFLLQWLQPSLLHNFCCQQHYLIINNNNYCLVMVAFEPCSLTNCV